MTAADYHADRSRVSASSLKLFAEAPRLWWDWRNGREVVKDSPTFALGRMVHTLALEPDTFGDTYAVVPLDAPRRPSASQREAAKPSPATLAAIEFWDTFGTGKQVVSAEDYGQAESMAAALFADAGIGPRLRMVGEVEKTIYFDGELLFKARLDKVCGGVILDIKTTVDASTEGFKRAAIAYGYHIQAAHYCAAYEAAYGRKPEAFFFTVVEKTAPFLTHLFKATAEFLRHGETERAALIKDLAACMESGHYPGYCRATEGYTDLELPRWIQPEEQEIS